VDSIQKLLTPKKNIDLLKDALTAKQRGQVYSAVFIGVNGVGKSTSLAKVAYYLKTKGNLKVMIAGCDNFRSGAIEQLQTHCACLDIPLYEKGYKDDPAIIAKEALQEAKSKGYDVLLACARDAARRDLPLEFILAGHSTDDDRLFATGRVFITGRYDEPDGPALVRGLGAHMAFLPSIWPETWGFTLGLAWRCGLRATVFDIGAMAARVRNTGHGWVLPLGLSPQALNNHFLAPR
jgi:hypothetical protein